MPSDPASQPTPFDAASAAVCERRNAGDWPCNGLDFDDEMTKAALRGFLTRLSMFRSDLEMVMDDHGGDAAAPGPNRRIVALARALMEHVDD